MPDIVLKDRAGNDLTYAGAPSVKVPNTSGELVEFFSGEKVEKTIDPDFSEGNIEVIPEEGTFLEKVTVNKPEALLPENIREDETVAGVTGTLPVYELTEKTVELDFSGGDMTITAEEKKPFESVIIQRPETLTPGNIAKDVEIAGIVGMLSGGGELDLEGDFLKYVVYQIDDEKKEIIICGILYSELFADTGKYDVNIPANFGAYSVVLNSKGVS